MVNDVPRGIGEMMLAREARAPRWLIAMLGVLVAIACMPVVAFADDSGPVPTYQTLGELKGKRIAYVNGSVYNQNIEKKVDGTHEQFYASLADCIAAVEAGKADAAVQLSYCLELAVNRRGGTVALLPENVDPVDEAFFFPHGDPLIAKFNEIIKRYEADGTIERLRAKWVSADESGKTLPAQDWDAPNGTLKFATSGVLDPYSYVGDSGKPTGYDVEIALLIAKELGYHLEVSTIPMDSIFAAVQTGKVDFGGTLTNTKERAEVVDFTEKVIPSYVSVIVAAKNAPKPAPELEFTSFDQLNGHNVGVLNGTITSQFVDKALGGSRNYVYFNSVGDMVAALKAGKVDAFCSDEPVSLLAANQNEGIGVMPGKVADDQYGLIFPKGSPLKAEFDQVIEGLEADGTLDEIKKKWTGADESAKTMPEPGWPTPKGTLKMGTCAILEPISYVRGTEIVGYEIEVAELVCKKLGYGLEIVNQEFMSCLAGVETGKYDFGGGAISISAERQEKMDFSIPEYQGAPVFVVRTVSSDGESGGFLANLSESFHKTFIQEDRWQLIAGGLGVTVLISVCSGVLGTLLGYLTVLARRSNIGWLTKLVSAYQALMGGIPLVVVLMVLYYVVFGAFDVPGAPVAIIAFTLAFGSASGSTMWTAVDGIDTIQEETGLALGYTRKQVFRKIIFPQARQQFMPQLAGQFVGLVKDTAIVGYIAVQDLTRASDLIRARTMEAFFPLIATAIIYFLFCRLLSWVLGRVVARLDATARPRKIEGVVEDREVEA